jgi:hypothetical protein
MTKDELVSKLALCAQTHKASYVVPSFMCYNPPKHPTRNDLL